MLHTNLKKCAFSNWKYLNVYGHVCSGNSILILCPRVYNPYRNLMHGTCSEIWAMAFLIICLCSSLNVGSSIPFSSFNVSNRYGTIPLVHSWDGSDTKELLTFPPDEDLGTATSPSINKPLQVFRITRRIHIVDWWRLHLFKIKMG